MTKWEHRELKKEQRLREKKLKEELLSLKEPSKYSNVGASRYEMGSERAREIEDMLLNTNLEMLERAEDLNRFLELKGRIHRLGTEDYYLKMNEVFRENWLNVLSRYSHFDNYDKVVQKLKQFKKAEDFYKFIKKSELGLDFLYQSDEFYTQQEFNNLAQDLGIDERELIDSAS